MGQHRVWLATFLLTVFADLTVAVEVGMVLAALLYIRKVTQTTTVSRVTKEYVEDGRAHILQDSYIPKYVTVVRIHGPFLFGATDKLAEVIDRAEESDAGRDPAAAEHDGHRRHRPAGAGRPRRQAARRRPAPILCGARPQPAQLMHQAEIRATRRPGEHLPAHRGGPGTGAVAAPRHASRGEMKAPSVELQTMKARFFGALAHPIRIRLLEVLTASGEMSVQELQRRLRIDQPIVSQQLGRLRASRSDPAEAGGLDALCGG